MTQDQHDPLKASWQRAGDDLAAEETFLRELSYHAVLTILQQPPGSGAAEPGRNLVHWQHHSSGDLFVPIFTHASHLTISIPAPTTAVRVSMRILLAAGGGQRYIVNPLAPFPFELDPARISRIRAFFAAQGLDPEEPSRQAPWAFRLPDDALYPVAVALVTWFNASGWVDEAYLYELTRGPSPPVVVLGLNHCLHLGLSRKLAAIAAEAGADPDTFEVRFITEEPSHRAGIKGINLAPFYRRPEVTRLHQQRSPAA